MIIIAEAMEKVGKEGVITVDIVLSSERKCSQKPRCYNVMWAYPMPWFVSMLTETQHMGEQDYAANPRRRQAAIAMMNGRVTKGE